jgi:hypothetical protein
MYFIFFFFKLTSKKKKTPGVNVKCAYNTNFSSIINFF